MHLAFWPDRAWSLLMGGAWPWLAPAEQPDAARYVRDALEPYWLGRLHQAPHSLLSARAGGRIQQAIRTITATSVGAAGLERVVAAAAGQPEPFWFLEVGSAAWMLEIQALRRDGLLPLGDDAGIIGQVEAAWASTGAAAAAALLDAQVSTSWRARPVLALYRAPLALWETRDPALAADCLDAAGPGLTQAALRRIGGTLLRTYALTRALRDDVAGAAAMLDPDAPEERPRGWGGVHLPETQYHRIRYLAALKQVPAAMALLQQVVAQEPAYALRAVTDPALLEVVPGEGGHQMQAAIGEVVQQARARLASWQQSRPAGDAEVPAVRRVLETLEFAGDEPFMVLAAASLLPEAQAWRERQAIASPTFYATIDRLHAFARGLPAGFPLRLGPGFAPRFVGDQSDMRAFEALLDDRDFPAAKAQLDAILGELPQAIRMAAITYAQRLVNALATSAELLQKRGREADRVRFERLVQLLQTAMTLVEPIKSLSDDVGPNLLYQVQRLWEKLSGIEAEWVRGEAQAIGQLRLEPPAEALRVPAMEWRAFVFRVADVAGDAVAGVPVLWRIVSGPARPRDGAVYLDGEWAVSYHTGAAYVTLEADRRGEGEIELRLLGQSGVRRMAYHVE